MSLFADCREKYTKQAYPFGTQFQKNEDIPKDEINPYWERHLKGNKKAFIDGYDTCVEDAVEGYFANLFSDGNLIHILGTQVMSNIDQDVLDDERSIDEFPLEEQEEWGKETLFLKAVKDGILQEAEMNRNEMVTAFLDDEPQKEADNR